MFGVSPFGVGPQADDEEARWLLLRGTGDLGHVGVHTLWMREWECLFVLGARSLNIAQSCL